MFGNTVTADKTRVHLQPLGASVSPLVLGLGADSSQGSGAAGTTEAGHGRGSPQGGHAPAHTGLQAPQPLSGSPPWPQPAPRSPPSQRRPQARTPRADTVVSGECPPQRRPFSRLPGAGLREGGVTSAESAVKARPEHHTSLKGNVCSLNVDSRVVPRYSRLPVVTPCVGLCHVDSSRERV